MSSPRGRRGERGFTLVEILIALGIMAFGATVAIGLISMATITHKRAIDRTNAALLADAALAELRGALTFGLVLEGLPPAAPPPPAPGAAPAGTGPSATEPTSDLSIYVRQNATHPAFPDYVFDAVLTPLDLPQDAASLDEADAFHAEITIRWKASGRQRTAVYHSVVLRRVAMRDLR